MTLQKQIKTKLDIYNVTIKSDGEIIKGTLFSKDGTILHTAEFKSVPMQECNFINFTKGMVNFYENRIMKKLSEFKEWDGVIN